MEHELLRNAEKFQKKRQKKKIWQRIISALGCVVVFCVTYALVLPAITEEKETFCGKEEHIHEDACYTQTASETAERILICTLEEKVPHVHGDTCYALQEGHVHGESCFRKERGELLCQIPETEGHVHSESCYVPGDLTCTAQENHTHTEGCYAPGGLTCAVLEGHVHAESCYTDGTLTCTEPENHVHDARCYGPAVLICTEPENHVHGGACYQQILTCQQEEIAGHTHDDSCYALHEVLVCTLEETPPQQVLSCGLEEYIPENEEEVHIHGESCYAVMETGLTCQLTENENHKHSDRCYGTWELTCGLEEHTHDLRCAANPNADLENRVLWEQTFADVELTGVWAEDVLAIAETQLGYRESQKNYVVLDGSNETKGYTRYGAWYGIPYGDWCAMFVSFCLDYAGVEDYPLDCNCPSWINALTELEMYQTPDVYTPVPGDVIFFDWNENLVSDHVGLVKEVDLEKGELITIEGNNGNTVAEHTYKLDDTDLLGYGILPENPEQEPVALAQQVLDAAIYTDETYAELAQDDTAITVSGLLPVGAEVKAYPVALQTDIINGRQVILAYDISVFDKNGRLFEQADASLNVSIRPADWEEKTEEDEADYNVYYIPEEGDPQPMDTTADEAAVNFQTDHFSTYALTASGTLNAVYLNGAAGNDSNAGTSANTAVKTLEKAMALVKTGGTINICGTVTVSNEQEWDVESKVTIKRGSNFTGPLIVVADGGSLVLSNITINGGSGTPSSSNIDTNTTYASGSAKAPLIVVNSGGALTIDTGAVLEYNSNKPNVSSNNFAESGYIGLGGAIYCNGTLTMKNGLIQYCEALCGGGVYVENGTFDLNGGLIDHNYARDIISTSYRPSKYHKNAGGGVYVGDNSTMNMTGGAVSNNQSSREGGGISLGWLDRRDGSAIYEYITTFNMTGGTITGNTATSTGGGLNITAGRQAFISAGTFTNNRANGQEYQTGDGKASWTVYSGGAIYLDAQQTDSRGKYAGKPGYAVVNRVLIANNEARYYGGGIATCSTSASSVNSSVDLKNGTAIYNNTASEGNEMHLSGTVSGINGTVLGGGKYNWSKSGSAYDNSLTDNSQAIIDAKKLATVIITGNYGYDGGGIGCNGEIVIGGEPNTTSIEIIKLWDDAGLIEHPEYIEVQVLSNGKPYGEVIRIYRTIGSNGEETWPMYHLDGLPEGPTYTIEEIKVPGFSSTISVNGTTFTITNRMDGIQVVKKWVDEDGHTLTSGLPGSITAQLYQNGEPYGDPVELNAAGDWSYIWFNLPEKDDAGNLYVYTVKELSVPEGFYSTNSGLAEGTDSKNLTITNIKSPETSVSVEKNWAEGATVAESVTIQLLRNGEAYGIPVELSNANDWFYKWEGLPTKDTSGNPYTYTVIEIAPDIYDVTIVEGEKSAAPIKWTKVTGLESGKTYLLVSDSGALAADGSSLSWQNVSQNLADGTNPNNAALWTYNGSTLKSGSGKFLKLDSSGSFLSPTYTYVSGDTGSTVSFSSGYISVKPNILTATKYFGTIDTNNGTASTLDEKASATTFTAYTLTEGADPCAHWGVTHYVVTNTDKPVIPMWLGMNFVKYSEGIDPQTGNPTVLAGAKLELYKEDPNGDVTIPGTDVLGIKITEWESEVATHDNLGGIHHVDQIMTGTYYLVETKAPDGHLGLDGPIIFQVSAEDQTATVTSYPGRPELEGEVGEVLPIYNDVAVVLPETGGPGTYLYTTAGLLLMLTSAAYLVYNSRKRRREAH